jgi:hypothetical protein
MTANVWGNMLKVLAALLAESVAGRLTAIIGDVYDANAVNVEYVLHKRLAIEACGWGVTALHDDGGGDRAEKHLWVAYPVR